jgi:hypothetical protein
MTASVTPDLRVLDARQDGNDLLVDVYGGPTNACRSVRLVYRELRSLRAALLVVRRWRDRGQPVALVIDETKTVLIEESVRARS